MFDFTKRDILTIIIVLVVGTLTIWAMVAAFESVLRCPDDPFTRAGLNPVQQKALQK